MYLVLSYHAKEKARERGVSVEEIKKAIQQGAKFFQDKEKIVSDFAHIRVVYKIKSKTAYMITVMIK